MLTDQQKITLLRDALECLCIELTKGYNVTPKPIALADCVHDALAALNSTKG